MMKNHSFLILTTILILSACGIKPSQVSPPEGAEDSGYPHEYPSPATDPAP